MCGITGFWEKTSANPDRMVSTLTTMMGAIAHRGPDSQGQWIDAPSGLAFGHLRLAIVDLSEAGHQPMTSASGRYTLTYNGEIYNHLAMRRELESLGAAPAWQGGSDTETLLAAIDAWGIDRALEASRGMFALALWDRVTQSLTLARDRLGEKPLYYGHVEAGVGTPLLFGSELKAFMAHPDFTGQIDRTALLHFIRHGNVGENLCIWQGIEKVRPGETVTLTRDGAEPVRRLYWNGARCCVAPKGGRFTGSLDEAVAQLDGLLTSAVEDQMMSDVPLGAFLSGGIDSSTIVALMQKLSNKPVHTFSIGFNEARYNEAEHARAVASHLGTRHTDLYVSEQELLDVVPVLPEMYDEPFADSSQIPTFLVAQLARDHVTVALSGDGGDELFCGYDRYQHASKLMQRLRAVPRPLRMLVAAGIRALPATWLNSAVEPLRATPQGKEPNGQRIHRLARYAQDADLESLHRTMVSVWRFPEAAVAQVVAADTLLQGALPSRGDLSQSERLMQLDMLTYLPDDILTKVDRATMAVALESRAPMLDPRVVEFAWSLPSEMKLRGDVSKWVLRQVLFRYVPQALVERPKMGFEVPIGLWLRGPLQAWAAALLDPVRLQSEGHLEPGVVSRMWRQHLAETHNWGPQLWNVLMFQQWWERWSKAS